MKIKIITEKGFRYEGKKISQDNLFIEINDNKEGIVKIPISAISLLKENQDE